MSKSKLFEVDDHVLREVSKTFDRSVKSLNEDVKLLQEWMKTQTHLPEILKADTLHQVAKSFNRSEEALHGDVEILKNWMKTQPHLPELMDDKTIQNFLILNKCSIERAKIKIDMYYTVRSLLPDIFEQINPKSSSVKQAMEKVYFVPLPKLTKEMYRVIVLKMKNKSLVNKLEPYDTICYSINVQEMRLKEDVTFGDIYIVDNEGITLAYLLKWTPTIMYKYLIMIYERVYSSRLKGVYMVNFSPYMEKILAVVKTLMKSKLYERIHICKDASVLSEIFPKEILPKDYGGEEKSLEELQEMTKQKFLEYQDFLTEWTV